MAVQVSAMLQQAPPGRATCPRTTSAALLYQRYAPALPPMHPRGRAVARRYRPALAHCFLLFLCITSGMFAASTSMLPSSFTMYALTAAAAGMLEGTPYPVIAAAAIGARQRAHAGLWLGCQVGLHAACLPCRKAGRLGSAHAQAEVRTLLTCPAGVVWGWCVAGFAFLPYALWVLAAAPLLRSVGWLVLCLAGTLGPLVLVDRHLYGAWTVRAARVSLPCACGRG